MKVWSQLASSYRGERKFLKDLPIARGPNLKLCWLKSAAFVGRLGHRIQRGYPRTIPSKFGSNRPSSFSGEDFLNLFPLGS